MQTKNISLIETQFHPNGTRTYDQILNLEVIPFEIKSTCILLKDKITQDQIPYLLQVAHQELTTLLEVTGVTPYEIWYFDEAFQFTGKAFSLHQGTGTFRIQTQAKWILFLSYSAKVYEKLKVFKCNELNLEPKEIFTFKRFHQGYGQFPYFIINHKKSPCFTQIPIVINPESDAVPGIIIKDVPETVLSTSATRIKLLVEKFKEYYASVALQKGKEFPMALVLDQDSAYYLTPDETISFNTSIPYGGTLLDQDGKRIASNTEHYF